MHLDLIMLRQVVERAQQGHHASVQVLVAVAPALLAVIDHHRNVAQQETCFRDDCPRRAN